MCRHNFQIALLTLVFFSPLSWALDTAQEEKACLSIGFKNKSPAFGNCVLELLDRKNTGPLSADEPLCQNYGFRPGTTEYSTCKQQIDLAKQTAKRQEEQYREQKRQYDEQIELQRERERREKNQRALDLSLRLMSGQSPVDAMLSTGSGLPVTPRVPPPQTIILPNGRHVTCTTQGNTTNCF